MLNLLIEFGEEIVMKRAKELIFLVAFISFILFQGCVLDITSITVPGAIDTGKVMIITIKGESTDDVSTNGNGIVLQIPDGTEVLRAHFELSSGYAGTSDDLVPDSTITSGYTSESGYQLWGGIANESNGRASGTLKIWLSIPNDVTPGTYKIKAAVGGFVNSVWTPQNPKASGLAITDFSNISGNYTSNSFDISKGESDTTPPSDVSFSISQDYDHFLMDMISYNEEAEGDIAKYRVYVSKTPFTDTTGSHYIGKGTATGFSFSSDIGSGLYYFELPPGAEYYGYFPITGLSINTPYYFAVTAVDVSGNESQPNAVSATIIGCRISGLVKDSSGNGIPGVSVEVYNEAGEWTSKSDCFAVGEDVTDENGRYNIFVPSEKGCKVYFDPLMNRALYLGQWYDNKTSFPEADLITVGDQEQKKVLKDVILRGPRKCGDCNNDNQVTIDEVQKVIDAFLGK